LYLRFDVDASTYYRNGGALRYEAWRVYWLFHYWRMFQAAVVTRALQAAALLAPKVKRGDGRWNGRMRQSAMRLR